MPNNEYEVRYEFLNQKGDIMSAAESVKARDLAEAKTKGEDLVLGRRILDPEVVEITGPTIRLLRIHSWK